jgi:hypothetical protein
MHGLKNSFKHRTPPRSLKSCVHDPAAANAADPIPRMLLREGLSCRVLSFSSVSSLISLYPYSLASIDLPQALEKQAQFHFARIGKYQQVNCLGELRCDPIG